MATKEVVLGGDTEGAGEAELPRGEAVAPRLREGGCCMKGEYRGQGAANHRAVQMSRLHAAARSATIRLDWAVCPLGKAIGEQAKKGTIVARPSGSSTNIPSNPRGMERVLSESLSSIRLRDPNLQNLERFALCGAKGTCSRNSLRLRQTWACPKLPPLIADLSRLCNSCQSPMLLAALGRAIRLRRYAIHASGHIVFRGGVLNKYDLLCPRSYNQFANRCGNWKGLAPSARAIHLRAASWGRGCVARITF